MEPSVRTERVAATMVVTIDRPARRNAIDGPTAEALHAAYQEFVGDDTARVLVLTGAGGVFCAGADLTDLASLRPRLSAPEGTLGFTRLVSPKPTIAAIEGWAVAGGLELALWCDLRVAAAGARMGFLERRWGVPLLDGGTQRLPRVVGLGRALDLVLTGRLVDAVEARAMGLVTQVVEDGEATATALQLAEVLTGFPQETMLVDRSAVLAAQGLPLPDGLALEARLGTPTVSHGVAGAQRFADGAGRGGA